MPQAKKILTNIRPKEVSLVDNPANMKDFLLTKNEDGEVTPVEPTEPVVETPVEPVVETPAEPVVETPVVEEAPKTEEPVLKKMEVALHSICFAKYLYPEKVDAMKALASQGIDPTTLEFQEDDYEFRFILNSAEMFQGVSLALGYYMPMGQGVDGLIGVMKRLNLEVVEKKGAKISASRLTKIKDAMASLESLIKEIESEPDQAQEKSVNKEEENMNVEAELKKRDEEIEVLKAKVAELETTPAEKNGAEVDNTEVVTKKSENFWKGVL